MTHSAVSELGQTFLANVVCRQQFTTTLELVRWWFPFHIENLIFGSEIAFGRFVAIDAPAHVERVGFPGQRHLIDSPVTGRTSNSFLNVNAVVEKDEIRQLIDPLPMQWLAGCH